jgi:gluconokinase
MPRVPGLRSPYARVGRLVLFGRVLDKIRLHAAGRLPAAYVTNLGDGHPMFADGRCCRFLGVRYQELRDAAIRMNDDHAVLAWAEHAGQPRTDEECEVWNGSMMKLGWRDNAASRLQQRLEQSGLAGRPIETVFDLMDFDEGRDPVACRAWEGRPSLVIVPMGVAGSGKTTIGESMAAALGWEFRDADEFHPPENVAKMAAGIPLTDEDRQPWLESIRSYIERMLRRDEPAIVSCSALRAAYRDKLRVDPARVKLVHLSGDAALIRQRLEGRAGHFMKPEMLTSQLQTLEPPAHALTIDVSLRPADIVAAIRNAFSV